MYRLTILACTLGWTVTAWAAAAAPDLIALPWAQIGVGAVLALWGGLTRTADRALTAYTRGQPFLLLPELAKDLVMATGAGFCTYVWGSWQAWGPWQTAGALWAAGYLGALLPVEALRAKLSALSAGADRGGRSE